MESRARRAEINEQSPTSDVPAAVSGDQWLVAVRHAPIAVAGLCYGRTDVEAALPAPDAARTIAERLPRLPGAIWTSPSSRCLTPAIHLGQMIGVSVTSDDRLQELDFGRWDGRPWWEIEEREGSALAAWMADWVVGRPPSGESLADLERRVRAWMGERPQIPTLVLTHAGVIRALRVILEDVPWPLALSADVPHLEPLGFGE